MQVASFLADGRPGTGVVDGHSIRPWGAADAPHTLRELLDRADGPDHAARLGELLSKAAGSPLDLDEVEFAPVISDPRAIWCAALTFPSHIGEAPGRRAPDYPLFFPRVAASQTGHRQPLVIPRVSDQLDYEGELAVVIGRTARHVPEADALSYVAGYSIYNEGSIRDWQRHTTQIAPGKNFAGTGAFGPWLVTPEAFDDPYAHTITTQVNGEVRQHESIGAMVFSIEYFIHYLSTMHTLLPGDVIVCGTPGGVGLRMDPPRMLEPGDVVTVQIDGIGTLENPVEREPDDPNTPVWRCRSEVNA